MTRRDRLILIVVAGVAVAGGAIGLGLSGRLATTTPAAAASPSPSAADGGATRTRPEWVTACNPPAEMQVAVDLEVQNGKVTDATVRTAPADSKVADCIRSRVRNVKWFALSQPQHISFKF